MEYYKINLTKFEKECLRQFNICFIRVSLLDSQDCLAVKVLLVMLRITVLIKENEIWCNYKYNLNLSR